MLLEPLPQQQQQQQAPQGPASTTTTTNAEIEARPPARDTPAAAPSPTDGAAPSDTRGMRLRQIDARATLNADALLAYIGLGMHGDIGVTPIGPGTLAVEQGSNTTSAGAPAGRSAPRRRWTSRSGTSGPRRARAITLASHARRTSISIPSSGSGPSSRARSGLLPTTKVEKLAGKAEVRKVFKIRGVAVAGSYVIQGKIGRSNLARLVRDGTMVWEGKIDALKRFKDDAKEVAEGFECGISLDGFNDIKEMDIVESYEIEEIKQKL